MNIKTLRNPMLLCLKKMQIQGNNKKTNRSRGLATVIQLNKKKIISLSIYFVNKALF